MDHPFRTRRFAGAEGLELTADIAGDPAHPTVILLHGGGQTRHSWSGAMRAFVDQGYQVINLDARGHGESDWSATGNYSVRARSLDLLAVLGQIEGPSALVGASMGGATALYTACSHGDLNVKALILVDIVPTPSALGVQRIKDFMHKHLDGFATVEAAIAAVAAYNPARRRPPDANGIAKNLRRSPDGMLKWHWDPQLLRLESASESLAVRNALDAASQGHHLPTLLIRGLQSDVVLDEGVAQLREKIPSLEVMDVPGAGHMVAGDKNDAFNAGVLQFLMRNLPPRERRTAQAAKVN